MKISQATHDELIDILANTVAEMIYSGKYSNTELAVIIELSLKLIDNLKEIKSYE